jgi:hypothetical protein
MTVRLSVVAGAALGFRDVTVTTGGETARGDRRAARGSWWSARAPARGATVDVRLAGADTTFGPTSVANFGDGIAVDRLTVSSPTAAVARVKVAPGAVPPPPRSPASRSRSRARPGAAAASSPQTGA